MYNAVARRSLPGPVDCVPIGRWLRSSPALQQGSLPAGAVYRYARAANCLLLVIKLVQYVPDMYTINYRIINKLQY